jgi:hypothetical protein
VWTEALEVETLRLSAPRVDPRSYQGLFRTRAEVQRQTEHREVPAGSLWIPADQPDFEVAVQLFEPEAPDSLLSWGLLATVFERREYIGMRELEELARRMLDDPATRREWEAALGDEAFAGDVGRRYEWWYRRTPYWDELVGLMPVMRLMHPPGFQTLPWDR